MDILGLPHAIMITTADVTDRNGAIDMVDYYCDITDNLSLILIYQINLSKNQEK